MGGNKALKYQDVMNGNEADKLVFTSPTIDTSTGKIYLKFVNAEAKDKTISVSLDTNDDYTAEVEFMTSHNTNLKNQGDQNYYSSHPDTGVTFSYDEAIKPHALSIGVVRKTFEWVMPENSVGVLRLTKR